ncbi:MAG: DUF1987 domain-containing protein [Cyclobacteriaceae bacterium]|nr:DUF1987 domain-containing protein [Cyclobacteriaceae bacterium]
MDIYLPATKNTPEVTLDLTQKFLKLKGVSSPENNLDFYDKIIDALNIKANSGKFQVDVSFIHFNTSSSKSIFTLFQKLKSINNEGNEVEVNWHYEQDDEDMLECGQDFSELLDMHFNFIEYKL